jgi:hypothetical protein
VALFLGSKKIFGVVLAKNLSANAQEGEREKCFLSTGGCVVFWMPHTETRTRAL